MSGNDVDVALNLKELHSKTPRGDKTQGWPLHTRGYLRLKVIHDRIKVEL